MSIINALLTGSELTFSKEELDAEQEVVAQVIEDVPETPAEVEAVDAADAEEEAVEAADDKIEEADEAAEDLDEVATSLESLVEFLALESGAMTAREVSMIHALANAHLQKAKIEPATMSFEEVVDNAATTDRETVKSGIGAKAKQLASAAWEAIKRIIASIGEWFDKMFDGVQRTRGQLVGLAKALGQAGSARVDVKVPKKFAVAMDYEVPVLAKAAKAATHSVGDTLLVEATKAAKATETFDLAGSFQEAAKAFGAVALPGNPKISYADGKISLAVNEEELKVDEETNVSFEPRRAASEISALISVCDQLTTARKDWARLSKEIKPANEEGVDGEVARFRRNAAREILSAYSATVKRFVSYALELIRMRAGAYAVCAKQSAKAAAAA